MLDRLTTCISTISRLIDYIQSAVEAMELEEDEVEAIDILQSQLSQRLDCVREISIEWQAHFDRIQMNATGTVSQQGGTSFRLTIKRATQGPGRPRFNFTKEQLEYIFVIYVIFLVSNSYCTGSVQDAYLLLACRVWSLA